MNSYASSHQKKPVSPTPIPRIKKEMDAFIEWLIRIEKQHYPQHNIIPFEQHAAKLRIKGQQVFTDLHNRLSCARNILKEYFELEEKKNPAAFEGTTFSLYEEAAAQMANLIQLEAYTPSPLLSLQEQMDIPWEWMDRAYAVGNQLFDNKRYAEAEDVYYFLCHMQPSVFDYWLGQATCQHVLGKFQTAIDTYAMSLILNPDSALVFFQMADCFLHMSEKERSLKSLDFCIECTEDDETQKSLRIEAMQRRAALAA